MKVLHSIEETTETWSGKNNCILLWRRFPVRNEYSIRHIIIIAVYCYSNTFQGFTLLTPKQAARFSRFRPSKQPGFRDHVRLNPLWAASEELLAEVVGSSVAQSCPPKIQFTRLASSTALWFTTIFGTSTRAKKGNRTRGWRSQCSDPSRCR